MCPSEQRELTGWTPGASEDGDTGAGRNGGGGSAPGKGPMPQAAHPRCPPDCGDVHSRAIPDNLKPSARCPPAGDRGTFTQWTLLQERGAPLRHVDESHRQGGGEGSLPHKPTARGRVNPAGWASPRLRDAVFRMDVSPGDILPEGVPGALGHADTWG